MLLKDCYSLEPPTERLDALWPSVSESLDESPAAEPTPGGGATAKKSSGGGEIVFQSSAAMQILNIPEPPPEPVASDAAATESAGAVAPQPPAPAWRWPVAFVFAIAFVVGGALIYKKMEPPPTLTQVAALSEPERARMHPGDPGHAEPPASAPGETAGADEASPGDEPTPPGSPGEETTAGEPKAEPGAEPGDQPEPRAGAPAKARPKSKARKRRPRKEAKAAARPAAKAAPAPAPRRKPARVKKKKPAGDDLDSLIDGVIGKQAQAAKKKKAAAKPTAPAAIGLPDKLSEGHIRNGMKRIMGRVQACYDKHQVEGRANVKLTINPTGKPGKVSVKGKFFGTDTGTCVVNAVKQARFPKFGGKPMTIRYPFVLQ